MRYYTGRVVKHTDEDASQYIVHRDRVAVSCVQEVRFGTSESDLNGLIIEKAGVMEWSPLPFSLYKRKEPSDSATQNWNLVWSNETDVCMKEIEQFFANALVEQQINSAT